MSYKVSMKNGINCTEAQWIKSNNLVDTTVKLAGEEAKDRLYEPKDKKKLVRVLTVIAYVFFVCLAAIMLSLYYIFIWNGGQKTLPRYNIQPEAQFRCHHISAEMPQMSEKVDNDVFTTSSTIIEENTTIPDDYGFNDSDLPNSNTFMKKLISPYWNAEND